MAAAKKTSLQNRTLGKCFAIISCWPSCMIWSKKRLNWLARTVFMWTQRMKDFVRASNLKITHRRSTYHVKKTEPKCVPHVQCDKFCHLGIISLTWSVVLLKILFGILSGCGEPVRRYHIKLLRGYYLLRMSAFPISLQRMTWRRICHFCSSSWLNWRGHIAWLASSACLSRDRTNGWNWSLQSNQNNRWIKT